MSYAGHYSPIFTDGNINNLGVKIIDKEHFEKELSLHSATPIIESEAENKDDYPRVKYDYLYGFNDNNTEWSNLDVTVGLTIFDVGFDSNERMFREFWNGFASVCEPFEFYHSPVQWHYPDLLDIAERDVSPLIYHVKCDETVTVDGLSFDQNGRTRVGGMNGD